MIITTNLFGQLNFCSLNTKHSNASTPQSQTMRTMPYDYFHKSESPYYNELDYNNNQMIIVIRYSQLLSSVIL
jgi:hypothetical protein